MTKRAKFPDQYDWVHFKVLAEALQKLIADSNQSYSDEFIYQYIFHKPSIGLPNSYAIPHYEDRFLKFKKKMLSQHALQKPERIWHLETPVNLYLPENFKT